MKLEHEFVEGFQKQVSEICDNLKGIDPNEGTCISLSVSGNRVMAAVALNCTMTQLAETHGRLMALATQVTKDIIKKMKPDEIIQFMALSQMAAHLALKETGDIEGHEGTGTYFHGDSIPETKGTVQ